MQQDTSAECIGEPRCPQEYADLQAKIDAYEAKYAAMDDKFSRLQSEFLQLSGELENFAKDRQKKRLKAEEEEKAIKFKQLQLGYQECQLRQLRYVCLMRLVLSGVFFRYFVHHQIARFVFADRLSEFCDPKYTHL